MNDVYSAAKTENILFEKVIIFEEEEKLTISWLTINSLKSEIGDEEANKNV